MNRSTNSNHKKIVWARNMLLDTDLYGKTEIEILNHLTSRDYEIFYISGSTRGYEFKNPKIHLFSVRMGKSNLPLKYHLISTVVQLFAFPYYLLKRRPNFVITDWDSVFSLMPMLPFRRLLRVKVVLDVRSTPITIDKLEQKVGLRTTLLSLAFSVSVCIAKKRFDGITIITDLMKKEICDRFDIDPDRVGVWSSGVSTELFSYERYARDGMELRERLGLSNRLIVFYHGAFSESRGLIEVIEAMSLIKERYPKVVLFLLGTGPIQTLDSMKKAIQDNGLQERVIIHAPVDYTEVPRYISMCDVGIVPLPDLPQWRNQCPLKLLEYLSMKKAVILSDIPCHRDVVGTNGSAIYLSSPSAAGIAESMAFVAEKKDKLRELGAQGRPIVENKYTWERIAQNLQDYLETLDKRRKENYQLGVCS